MKTKLAINALMLLVLASPSAHAVWTYLGSASENEREFVDLSVTKISESITQIETMTATSGTNSYVTWEVDCKSRKIRRTRIIIEDVIAKTKGIVPAHASDWREVSRTSYAGLLTNLTCKPLPNSSLHTDPTGR